MSHQSHFRAPLTERLWRVCRWTHELLTPLFYPPVICPPGQIVSQPPVLIKDNLSAHL